MDELAVVRGTPRPYGERKTTPSTALGKPAVAGIALLAVAVVGAVLLLVLVPESDFRPDYLLVGSIPVAFVLVGGGLLLASGLGAVSGPALSWLALALTAAGWIMVVAGGALRFVTRLLNARVRGDGPAAAPTPMVSP
jgi:hypothetical protein